MGTADAITLVIVVGAVVVVLGTVQFDRWRERRRQHHITHQAHKKRFANRAATRWYRA